MANDAELRRRQSRGQKARRLLDNEILKDAFAKIEAELQEAWLNSKGDEVEVRERAYLMQRLLVELKAEIGRIARTGEAASKELLRLQNEAKEKGTQS